MLADRFIGQSAAIQQLQTAIDAALTRGSILPHTLLIAPPGVGKTRLAQEISSELDAPYAEVVFPASHKDVVAMVTFHKGILLLDEIHQADRKTLDGLLTFLVDGSISFGRMQDRNTRLTIIAATTDPQKMPDAFRSRFRLEPRFEDYPIEDISLILQKKAETLGRRHQIDIPHSVCDGLAEASLGNPRQSLALLDTYVDLRVVGDEDVTSVDVLKHMGYTKQGLRPDHLKYLSALKLQGGCASVSTLSQMVFMPAAAMRWVERDLLRLGIISISSVGRELRSMDWEADTDEVASDATDVSGRKVNPYTLEPLSE